MIFTLLKDYSFFVEILLAGKEKKTAKIETMQNLAATMFDACVVSPISNVNNNVSY